MIKYFSYVQGDGRGWYVVMRNGVIISGPFTTRKEAEGKAMEVLQ